MIGVILDGEGTGIGYGPVGTLRAFRVVAQTETYDPGQLDRVPTPIQRVAPLYPYEMKQRGIEGTVCLVLVVDDLGRVRELRVEGSAQIFHSVAGVSGRCQPRLIVVEVDDGERSLALRKADQIPRGAGTWRVRGMRGGNVELCLTWLRSRTLYCPS